MTDEGATPMGAKDEWKPTKTPNKRAKAVRKRLAFMQAIYELTRGSWSKIPSKELASAIGVPRTVAYLRSIGVLEKKGVLYRWIGAPPTERMADDWCDHLMTYSRLRRDRDTPVKKELVQTYAAIRTADKQADKIESVLQWCYNSLHSSYRRISLSTAFLKRGIPHQAIRHLRDKALLCRPRNGVYKWIGPPPDREMALWLFGMLTEHHRSIYRSKMDKKQERTTMIDELIGLNTPSMPKSDGPILPAPTPLTDGTSVHRPYWQSSTITW